MSVGLTDAQRKFALCLFQGMSQQAAYREVYHPTYSTKSVSSAASKLARLPKIRAELARLMEKREETESPFLAERQAQQAETEAIATVAERKSRLTALLRHDPETPVSPGHIIAATSELNKMEHVYESRIGGDTSVTVVNILVRGEHMRELLAKVAERTGELLPAGRETPVAEASETEGKG